MNGQNFASAEAAYLDPHNAPGYGGEAEVDPILLWWRQSGTSDWEGGDDTELDADPWVSDISIETVSYFNGGDAGIFEVEFRSGDYVLAVASVAVDQDGGVLILQAALVYES